MTPHDSALDEDTDGDDKLVPRQSPSTGGAKSTKRNRLGKNQRQLLKDAANGKVFCLDTVSVPISNDIPVNDHVIPTIPMIYATLKEDDYHGYMVSHFSGTIGFHLTDGFYSFNYPDSLWYPYEVIAVMTYKVLDPMVPNACLEGYQLTTLAKYGTNPLSTTALQFWTSFMGKNALTIISRSSFQAFVSYFRFDATSLSQFKTFIKSPFKERLSVRTEDNALSNGLTFALAQDTSNYAERIAEEAAKTPVTVFMAKGVVDAPPEIVPDDDDEGTPASGVSSGGALNGNDVVPPATPSRVADEDDLRAEALAQSLEKQAKFNHGQVQHAAFVTARQDSLENSLIGLRSDMQELVSTMKGAQKSESMQKSEVSQFMVTNPNGESDSHGHGLPAFGANVNPFLGDLGLASKLHNKVALSHSMGHISDNSPNSDASTFRIRKSDETVNGSPDKATKPDRPNDDPDPSNDDKSDAGKPDGGPPGGGGPPDGGDGGGGGGYPNPNSGNFGHRLNSGINEKTKERALRWLQNHLPKLIGQFEGTVPVETDSQPIGTSAARWMRKFYLHYSDFERNFPEHEHGMSFMTCCNQFLPLCMYGDIATSETVQWWHSIGRQYQNMLTGTPPQMWTLDIFRVEFMARWTSPTFKDDWLAYLEYTLDYSKFPESTVESSFMTHWSNTLSFLRFIGLPELSADQSWHILERAFSHTVANQEYWEALTINAPNPVQNVYEFFECLEKRKQARYRQTQISLIARNNRGKQVLTGPEMHTSAQSARFHNVMQEPIQSVATEQLFAMLPSAEPTPKVDAVQQEDALTSIFCHITDHIIDCGNDSIEYYYAANGDNSSVPKGEDNRPLMPAAISSVCRYCNGTHNKKDSSGRSIGHFVRDCPKLNGEGKSFVGQPFGTADGFKRNDERPKWFIEQQQKSMRKRMAIGATRSKSANAGGSTYARNQRRSLATHPSQMKYQYLSDVSNEFMDDILSGCNNYDQIFNSVTSDIPSQ